MRHPSFFRSRKKTVLLVIIAILVLAVGVFMAANKIAPVSWGLWGDINSSAGVAIDGYDAVAYHTEGLAIKGRASISYSWKDVDWHFASNVNKALFAANPEQYAPQYGGYCAYAVSKGATASANPGSWDMQDGKLYLLVNEQVKMSWLNDKKDGVVNRADENWLKRRQ